MVQKQLNEIKARCKAATPVPWFNGKYSVKNSRGFPICCQFTNDNDKAFIAHARQDIPALLDYIGELQTTIKQLVDVLNDNIRIGNTAEKLHEENKKLRTENAALKERLEKAVELPCKSGDSLYYIKNNEIKNDIEVISITIDGMVYIDVVQTDEDGDTCCGYECKGCPFSQPYENYEAGDGGYHGEGGFHVIKASEISKTVFLTREEAEKALKEKCKDTKDYRKTARLLL